MPRGTRCRILRLLRVNRWQRRMSARVSLTMNCNRLKHALPARRFFLTAAAILLPLALPVGPSGAQTPHNNNGRSGASSVQLELVRTETGFFEAWKNKDQAYFREHMLENGIFWSDSGTISREQQLAELQASAKTCTVEG